MENSRYTGSRATYCAGLRKRQAEAEIHDIRRKMERSSGYPKHGLGHVRCRIRRTHGKDIGPSCNVSDGGGHCGAIHPGRYQPQHTTQPQ
jgi:hypothetical protein